MRLIFFLKALVAVMTMLIVVGLGFIVYGLLVSSQKPSQNLPEKQLIEKVATIQIPEEANFLSYQFHGDTITVLYSCGDSVIFYSMYQDGRRGLEVLKGLAPKPYDNTCNLESTSTE